METGWKATSVPWTTARDCSWIKQVYEPSVYLVKQRGRFGVLGETRVYISIGNA
jgi:hypothetical protein